MCGCINCALAETDYFVLFQRRFTDNHFVGSCQRCNQTWGQHLAALAVFSEAGVSFVSKSYAQIGGCYSAMYTSHHCTTHFPGNHKKLPTICHDPYLQERIY